jgi:hypothetical protein
LAGVSEATVPRAFVSVNGSDLNPCSAVQPCRSFNQALTVLEPGGEIVVQNSGGYSTGFTVTQSVTIDAAGFNASVISTGATNLCTINGAGRVVLRGISFHGANVGVDAIEATQVGSLYVEHCSISEFTGDAVHMPNGGNLSITGTDVRACGAGIVLQTNGATPAVLVAHDSRFTECQSGVQFGTSSSGAATGWMSNCTVSLCGLGINAFAATSAGGVDLTVTNCRAIGNTTGLEVAEFFGNATIRIANCVVTQNTTGIARTLAASVIGTSPGTNLISGNGTDGTITSNATLK